MNVAIAFGAGILSFASPCVLPLVPAFLVNMAGEAALAGTHRARTVAHALAFVLGFSTVFTLLWIGVALVGALAGEMVFWLQRVGGLLLVVLGMQMVGLIRIPFLAVLLVAYTLGLGVPFLLIAGGIGGAQRVARWLSVHIRVVNLAGGTLVIAMGLVLVSGQFARLPQLFNFLPLVG